MRLQVLSGLICLCWFLPTGFVKAHERTVSFTSQDGAVVVRIGDAEIARYIYHDPQVGRPYWTDVKTVSGIQVTRNHPPIKGQDADDHPAIHTGIWLSFGDLSGHDYWRLKAMVKHERFELTPQAGENESRFRVLNQYLAADKSTVIATETVEFRWTIIGDDYLLEWDTTLRPHDKAIVFGDQEEMGLGIRVATPLAVVSNMSGRILDSEGRRNGQQIWGKTAEWCDYSGTLGGKWVGITILAAPENFRASWCHARDYGFFAMNPFGRKAFTGEEESRLEVPVSQELKLRYGILVHESQSEEEFSIDEAWNQFCR